MKTTRIDDMVLTLNVSLEPNRKKVQQCHEKMCRLLEKMEKVTDLADAYEEGQPQRCLGDVMEEVRDTLADVVGELACVREIVTAKTMAWEWCDQNDEQGDDLRGAYVHGYMQKFYKGE